MTALKWAVANNACSGPGEAIEWLESLPEGTTMAEAWEQCQNSTSSRVGWPKLHSKPR
jgi:hypothetical protein